MAPSAIDPKAAAQHPDSNMNVSPTKNQAPATSQKESTGFAFPQPAKYKSLEEERQARKERLALAYRVFGQLGMEEGVAGHLTFRDPILTDHFWVNPFGLSFKYMNVSDLLLIGPDGQIKAGGKPELQYYNAAAFAIHHAIHTARPDLDAACHSHSIYGKAFSTLGRNIEITTQDSCSFYGQVAHYDSFGGVVVGADEGNNIARALGQTNKALILQNHGILTAGETIESAVSWFIMLERHCQVMLMSEAAAAGRGEKPVVVDDEEASFTHSKTGSEVAGHFFSTPYFITAKRAVADHERHEFPMTFGLQS
ncbi:hypothetical protein CBS101457_006616 [Exobasidium rhododendri]|nr:hypothetical protein CBS101457_006616 [Exobasidium rhododendri]